MWCGRCPKGDGWKVPEEDKAVYDEWQMELVNYHKENGSGAGIQ